MTDRERIIQTLKDTLAPLQYIHAMWLEGADATGHVDAYSDIDFWVDVSDEMLAQSMADVEAALRTIASIDLCYHAAHGHPKIRQRVYHLAGMSGFLMIDFSWQLHSRDPQESTLIEGSEVEPALVLFDKAGIVRYRPYDPAEFAEAHRERMAEAAFRYTQLDRVRKYVARGQYPEAQAYYMRYVVEPLVWLLRIRYTPANTDYGLVHISQHIPQEMTARLEAYLKVCSLEAIAEQTDRAGAWFAALQADLPDVFQGDAP